MISTYTPTLDADDVVKENFYADLDKLLPTVPNSEKIFLLEDSNARIGRESRIWRSTIGKYGVCRTYSNGILLLSKCAEFNPCITNTTLLKKNKCETAWKHLRSKKCHLLDYIIVGICDIKDIMITKASVLTENSWTHHRFVFFKINIRLRIDRRLKYLKRTRYDTNTQKNTR